MNHAFERIIVALFNRTRPGPAPVTGGVLVGHAVGDERNRTITIPQAKRAEHMAVLGRTGTGKSSLLRLLSTQDVRAGVGCVQIDFHAETTAYMVALLAAEERRRRVDLSDRVIVVDPGDPDWAVGLNVLEASGERERFLLVSEVTRILKQRWQLDSFGARTEELLRNTLLAVADAALTLVDVPPFLTDAAFRGRCLKATRNAEVRAYFATRFDTASESMQHVWREPVLNKLTALTADPQLRLMLGQPRSTLSLMAAIDCGGFVLLNLDKSRLGEQAATIGSLLFTKLKNAIFARRTRRPFTVYADEVQNLVTSDADLESLLSESRKYGACFCLACQHLSQFPPTMRDAVLAIGTHVAFQLAAPDADKMTTAFGGGKQLQALLLNLAPRHFVAKCGHREWQHGRVPTLEPIRSDATDLYARSRRRWARPRREVEAEIERRHRTTHPAEALDGWE